MRNLTGKWSTMYFQRRNLILSVSLCAFIGSLIGFIGQFITDASTFIDLKSFSLSPTTEISVPSDIPSPFPDGPGYMWSYSLKGRTLGSPFSDEQGKPVVPIIDSASVFHPPDHIKKEWAGLWYRLFLLDWLKQRGETAQQSAILASLVTTSVLLLIDYLKRNRRSKPSAT